MEPEYTPEEEKHLKPTIFGFHVSFQGCSQAVFQGNIHEKTIHIHLGLRFDLCLGARGRPVGHEGIRWISSLN